MAEVYLPQQPHLGIDIIREPDTAERNSRSTRTSDFNDLQPTQDFVFPIGPGVTSLAPSYQRIASNTETTPHCQTVHPPRPSDLSISPLPPFEFGASSTNSPTTHLVPNASRSPARLSPPLSHPTGHRRGGSEFIGGDIAHGGPVLLSTSLTTGGHDASSAPSSPHKGPSGGRRGHAHRRSGAVSQTDIKRIMQSPHMQKAGSAPSTPSDPLFQPSSALGSEKPSTRSQSTPSMDDGVHPPTQRLHSAPAQSRSRVGFSDHVEYIPRPLSTISSETSSSMSTVRANHSVTNSTSSIVSGGAYSPPSTRGPSPGQTFAMNENPSATGEVNSGSDTLAENKGISQSAEGPSSESTTESAGRTDVIGNRPASGQLPEPSPHDVPSSLEQADTTQDPLPQSSLEASIPSSNRQRPTSLPTRPRSAPEPKIAKKQHKVRSWAESILHRKGKHEQEDVGFVGPHASPPQNFVMGPEFSLDGVSLDNDTACIVEAPDAYASAQPTLQVIAPSSRPRGFSPRMDKDIVSPMIDLDAALGSLGGPSHEPTFDDYMGNFATGKRRLHSSGETGGFVGPGMHYHRRAESAPEMEVFDRTCYGFPRLGSNPAMSEAIEEEEEDTDQDARELVGPVQGLDVNVDDPDAANQGPTRHRSHHPVQQNIHRMVTPPAIETLGPVEIVSAEEEPRFSVLTKSSDGSTTTPILSPDPLASRPVSAPIDFALATPSMTHRTTPETTSAVSSADYTKTSFDCHDIPRIHTATSSITDRTTLNSSKVGCQSAASVDDVPSLDGSTSTTFSGRPTRFSSSGNTISSADRPASLSAAVPARTRSASSSKRTSLVSLSKLMGGSYNRSKLNIAETLPSDSPEKLDCKKRHRISRIMTFWKSKEKLPAG